jgi:hypothetical protein
LDIKLNFINRSDDQNDSDIVLCAKDGATGPGEPAIAWLVIRHCGQGDNHPFVYPAQSQVGIVDAWGNYSPRLDAAPGQAFAVARTPSGDELAPAGEAGSPAEIEVANDLTDGAISAMIFKSGALYVQRTGIAPGQMAAFQFRPVLWIGAVSQVEQGEAMSSAVLQSVDTELDLYGIAGADIVMTGGGPGPNSAPFKFSLENVVLA